jgi:serine/threonine protein kinase/formylglycine-generating enzyme required for sulfatase activity
MDSPADLPDPSSDRIAHYRILREIGRGGQATVYLAEDTRLHRPIALKVLDVGPAANKQAIERFRREAEITSKLDHPGICPVHDIGQDKGVLYIAMRYVEGETVAARIESASSGPHMSESLVVEIGDEGETTGFPPEALTPGPVIPPSGQSQITAILHVFEQAARALHAAHEHGVIHRDIKPGNIMVTKEGDPVILDFGLAQEVEGSDVSLTITGDMTGTPAYMSPEQLTAHRIRLDRRTDVYSLGVALYESLTLRRPFEAPTREGLYKQILTKDPPDPRSTNPSISSDLRVVVATALEKDCDRRYQTALDLAEDLRRVRMHEPILAKPVGRLVRLQRWAQRNPALAASVAVLFAVLTIGLTVALLLLQRSERERVAKERALGEKDTALSEKARALEDVTTQRNEKTAALADYDRLGDLSRLQRLQAEADTLWPADPSHLPGMTAWVEHGAALAGRLDGHRRLLDELRKSGVKVLPDSVPGESRPAASQPMWRFTSDAAQFKHDTTAKLVADLTALIDPDPKKGLLADVRSRLTFAASVERETIAKYESRWADAIRSIADRTECPKYDGLEIAPQLGLIPLCKDRASGLWEFVHLQTVAPGTDPIPARDQNGRLVVSEDMGIVFVLLPGGAFKMGAVKPDEDQAPTGPNVDPEARQNEGPLAEVALDPFFMSKYEMTQGQWLRLVGVNPSHYGPGAKHGGKVVGLTSPVDQVSWDDCDLWLRRLGLVIPTEAQWEYAARGGTTTPRWTGIAKDGLSRAANLADLSFTNTGGTTHPEPWNDTYAVHAPVGAFDPNPYGLHDVLGNVWEWCRDQNSGYDVEPRPGDGLRSSSASRLRALRGGSWFDNASLARSAFRRHFAPDSRNFNLGVRPAMACRKP